MDLQVNLAVKNNIPFLTTGGGHGYSTSFGQLDNGLELDMGGFKSVKVDEAASTLTVGGAVTFQDVYDPLYQAGKEIRKLGTLNVLSCALIDRVATGSCSCVGFIGGTLGAGVGRYQGIHGLIIDNLLSIDMITAAGNRITVSATENADLFWGFRGAGMNFGVVLSATYKVADLTNGGQVQDADFVFKAAQNGSYFNALASLQGKIPKELSLLTFVDYNATNGGIVILLNAVYPGPKDQFLQLIKPFTDLKPAVQRIHTLPWNRLLLDSGFGLVSAVCVKEQKHSMYSVGAKTLSSPTYISAFNRYAALFQQYPETIGSTLEIEFFPNQAVLATPDSATAYPWRDIKAQLMIQMQWTGVADDSPAANAANVLAKQVRSDFIKTSGYPEHHVYVSYAHGDEDPKAYYSAEKLPRLVDLKNKWDPKNVFRFDNSIPMKYP